MHVCVCMHARVCVRLCQRQRHRLCVCVCVRAHLCAEMSIYIHVFLSDLGSYEMGRHKESIIIIIRTQKWSPALNTTNRNRPQPKKLCRLTVHGRQDVLKVAQLDLLLTTAGCGACCLCACCPC